MRKYLIYETATGKIVHTHHAVGDVEVKSDDLLRLVHAAHDRASLTVVAVAEDSMQPRTAYRVNPQTKGLEETDRSSGSSGTAGTKPAPGIGASDIRVVRYTRR